MSCSLRFRTINLNAKKKKKGLVASPEVVVSAGTPQSTVGISATSGLANSIPSSPSGSATPQGPNQAEKNPAFILLGSLSISVPISVVSKGIISAVPLHLPIDSAVSRTAHTQHTLGSTSTSAATPFPFPYHLGIWTNILPEVPAHIMVPITRNRPFT